MRKVVVIINNVGTLLTIKEILIAKKLQLKANNIRIITINKYRKFFLINNDKTLDKIIDVIDTKTSAIKKFSFKRSVSIILFLELIVSKN